jgi:hypothetical protein
MPAAQLRAPMRAVALGHCLHRDLRRSRRASEAKPCLAKIAEIHAQGGLPGQEPSLSILRTKRACGANVGGVYSIFSDFFREDQRIGLKFASKDIYRLKRSINVP